MSECVQQMALVGSFALVAICLDSPIVAGLSIVAYTAGKFVAAIFDSFES